MNLSCLKHVNAWINSIHTKIYHLYIEYTSTCGIGDSEHNTPHTMVQNPLQVAWVQQQKYVYYSIQKAMTNY